MALQSLPSGLDAKLFLERIAKHLHLPTTDAYTIARGIQAWIQAHQGPIECVHCTKATCTYCQYRLACKEPVPRDPTMFFMSTPNGDSDLNTTNPLSVSAMYASGTFCDACMEWQARARWKPTTLDDYLEECNEGSNDCANGGGPGWVEYGQYYTVVIEAWNGGCGICAHGAPHWACEMCDKRDDDDYLEFPARFCKHGTCMCLKYVKADAARKNITKGQ